jgi:hypothetical protein
MSRSAKKEQVLETFGKVATELQLLLRAPQSLTVDEQLFIQNRLVMLQLEFRVWSHRAKIKKLLVVGFPATGASIPPPDEEGRDKS